MRLGTPVLALLVGMVLGFALYAFMDRPSEPHSVTRASLGASIEAQFPDPLSSRESSACRSRTRLKWRCELYDASGGTTIYDVTVTRDGCWVAPGQTAQQ